MSLITTYIIGDFDLRGRYLPTALTRLDTERLLGEQNAALCNFVDPCTGRRLSLADIETLHAAAREERGDHVPADERGVNLWDAAWEVLEDAEGLSYIDRAGTEWMIRRNHNGDVVLVDETASEAVQHNHVALCEDCADLVFGGEGDADQEERRWRVLDKLGIEDDRDLTELDDADLYWIGMDALQEDECHGCDCYAPLAVYANTLAVDRDYAELQHRNSAPPADEPDRDCPRFD